MSRIEGNGMFDDLRNGVIDNHSMRGFDEHECLFIHIPKTGGMSVADCLFGYQVGHHRVSELTEEFPDYYYRFAFVRDPYSRLRSAYKYFQQGGAKESDAEWAKENILIYPTFEDFVLHGLEKVMDHPHFRPQKYWLDGPVDFIGEFHFLQAGVNYVQSRLRMPPRTLPVINQSGPDVLQCGQKALEMIAALYADDFDLLRTA